MNDRSLDLLIASTARLADDELDLPFDDLAGDLDLQDAATALTGSSTGHGRRPRRLLMVAAAVVVCVATVSATQLAPTADRSKWASAAVRVAESSPRLLMHGAEVTRVDEFREDAGEMTFTTADGTELELHWLPLDAHQDVVTDRESNGVPQPAVEVTGTTANVLRYEGTDDYTALWILGDSSIEVRSFASEFGAFQSSLRQLHVVDVDTWLASMPASAVAPDSHDATVEAMLTDVPLPPGFSINDVPSTDGVTDRYQLGAAATGTVVCHWIRHWSNATAAGDTRAAADALDAMASARTWQMLREMDVEGDWPEVVWEHADAMAGRGEVPAGKPTSVVESARHALGCDRHW